MPALRTFTLLNKTAAQSVYTYPCNLVDFDGNLIAGAAGLFLQFHDKATAASAGNVPVKSFVIANAAVTPLASIFQAMGPVSFANGLSIGISSTEATYTAATATFDFFGEIEEGTQAADSISGLTSTTASGDTQATIYAANSPKAVYSISITNGEGVPVWPMFFNPVAALDGLRPYRQLPGNYTNGVDVGIADGATKVYYFGDGGYTFPDSTKNAVVILSTTKVTLTAGSGLASTFITKVK